MKKANNVLDPSGRASAVPQLKGIIRLRKVGPFEEPNKKPPPTKPGIYKTVAQKYPSPVPRQKVLPSAISKVPDIPKKPTEHAYPEQRPRGSVPFAYPFPYSFAGQNHPSGSIKPPQKFVCNNFYINISEERPGKFNPAIEEYSNGMGNPVTKSVISRNNIKRPSTSMREQPSLENPCESICIRKKLIRQNSQNKMRRNGNLENYRSCAHGEDTDFFKLAEELGIKRLDSESVADFLVDLEQEDQHIDRKKIVLEERQRLDLKKLDISAEILNEEEGEGKREFRIKTKVRKSDDYKAVIKKGK